MAWLLQRILVASGFWLYSVPGYQVPLEVLEVDILWPRWVPHVSELCMSSEHSRRQRPGAERAHRQLLWRGFHTVTNSIHDRRRNPRALNPLVLRGVDANLAWVGGALRTASREGRVAPLASLGVVFPDPARLHACPARLADEIFSP